MDALQKIWASIENFFKRDVGIKLGSFLLAILLWLFVVTSNSYVYQLQVPLRIVNIQDGKTLAEELPEMVTAQFRGTGITYVKTVITRPYSDMSLQVDVRRITNFYDYNLQDYLSEHPDNLILPRGLNLELVDIVYPEVIHVELDDELEIEVPVVSNIELNTAPGHTLVGDITLEPDSVLLRGPEETLAIVDSVTTAEIALEDAEKHLNGNIALNLPWGSLVNPSVLQVQYEADVQPISERVMQDIPVRVINVNTNLEVTTAPSTVTMTIEGGSTYIYNLHQMDINVYIDFAADWNPNQNYYVPHVETPEDVLAWRNINPKRVEVIVVRTQ